MKLYHFDATSPDATVTVGTWKNERWAFLYAAGGTCGGAHGAEDARSLQSIVKDMVVEDGEDLMTYSDAEIAYLFAEQMCFGLEVARCEVTDGGCSMCFAFTDQNDGRTVVVCYGAAVVLRVGKDACEDLSPAAEPCLVTDPDAAANAVVIRCDLEEDQGILIGTDGFRAALQGEQGETIRDHLLRAHKGSQIMELDALLKGITGTAAPCYALGVQQRKKGGQS